VKRVLPVLVAILGIAAIVILLLRPRPAARGPRPTPSGERVVSLAPALTETLFAIGAWTHVVGVSDYCRYPPEVEKLPRLGTSLTPNYEAIARIDPTLIVSEGNAAAKKRELSELARTELLPWLSLEEIVQSTRKLGTLVGKVAEANELADRLNRRLNVPEPATGPRVLIVIGYQAGKLDEVWFIRRNSLHGAMLRAAGGKNAVAEDVAGLPRVSLSRLIELDPDIIVILPPPTLAAAERDKLVADWKALELLRAVKDRRVVVFDAPDALTNGPRILELTDRLTELLKKLTAS
jgi:cobalamin transport system substrate-binding protein